MTFAVAFTLLGGLLLWFVVGSTGKWWAKLALILLVPAFGFFAWKAYGSFTGYPVRGQPPARAVFVAGAVDEPHWIYLWLIVEPASGPFMFRPGVDEPRAYRVPYTRGLHEQVEHALNAQKQGRTVALERRKGHGHGRYVSYTLPRPSLPRKG